VPFFAIFEPLIYTYTDEVFFAIYIPFSSLPQLFFTGKAVTHRVEREKQLIK
jgi:hypothetical protein